MGFWLLIATFGALFLDGHLYLVGANVVTGIFSTRSGRWWSTEAARFYLPSSWIVAPIENPPNREVWLAISGSSVITIGVPTSCSEDSLTSSGATENGLEGRVVEGCLWDLLRSTLCELSDLDLLRYLESSLLLTRRDEWFIPRRTFGAIFLSVFRRS